MTGLLSSLNQKGIRERNLLDSLKRICDRIKMRKSKKTKEESKDGVEEDESMQVETGEVVE